MKISRREFLTTTAIAYVGACLCCSRSALAQFPNPQTDLPVTGKTPGKHQPKSWSYRGCSLRTASEVNGAIGGQTLGMSTGIPILDQGLNRELLYLKPYFSVNPGVFTYQENNAFATTERLQNHQYPDGTVVLGTKLISELFGKFANTSHISMGDHALVGVLAHEFGHIAYFKSGRPMPNGKKPELHADFLAGWYTGIRATQLPGQVNLQETSKQMFDIGDFDFNSPSHHGTPQERVAAYLSGVKLSIENGAQVNFQSAFHIGGKFVGLW